MQQRQQARDPLGPVAKPWQRNVRDLDRQALNPQPLPPRDASPMRSTIGSDVALNPQPLPPRDAATLNRSAFSR